MGGTLVQGETRHGRAWRWNPSRVLRADFGPAKYSIRPARPPGDSSQGSNLHRLLHSGFGASQKGQQCLLEIWLPLLQLQL